MINNALTVNRSGDVPTLPGLPEKVFRHFITDQSAAMKAALMISGQYSQASKTQFRQECLKHLKASLPSAQDVTA